MALAYEKAKSMTLESGVGLETTEKTAKRLQVSPNRVRQLIKEGRIDAVKVSRFYLVHSNSWPREKGLGRPPNWASKVDL